MVTKPRAILKDGKERLRERIEGIDCRGQIKNNLQGEVKRE